jgi:hypothetical protein
MDIDLDSIVVTSYSIVERTMGSQWSSIATHRERAQGIDLNRDQSAWPWVLPLPHSTPLAAIWHLLASS